MTTVIANVLLPSRSPPPSLCRAALPGGLFLATSLQGGGNLKTKKQKKTERPKKRCQPSSCGCLQPERELGKQHDYSLLRCGDLGPGSWRGTASCPSPPRLAILLHQPLRLTRSGDPRGGQHSPQPINILADSICLYTGSFILPVCLSRISVRVFPYGSLPYSVAWQAFRAVAPVWAEGAPCARFQTYRAQSSRQHPYRAVLDGQKSFPRY